MPAQPRALARAFAVLAGTLIPALCQAVDAPRPAAAPAPPAAAPAPTSASAPAAAAIGMVGGTAIYRERVALGADAVFEAVLEDVSLADAPAQVLGRTRIDAPGQVPIRFAIAYDPARINARRRYSVRATIRDGGRLAFTTDLNYRPIADGRPQPLQLMLRAVAGTTTPSASSAPIPDLAPGSVTGPATAPAAAAGLSRLGPLPTSFSGVLPCADCTGIRQTLDLFADGAFHWRSVYLGRPASDAPDDVGRWMFASDGRTLLLFGGREAPVRFVVRDDGALRLLDLEGRPIQSTLNYELRRVAGTFTAFEPRATLRGAYVYFADAPLFTDCGTGQPLPVAQEADALALERAYTAARPAPAAPRIALLEGHIVQRLPMEGPNPRSTLVVERFLRLAAAGESCPPPPANAPLAGTRWRLTGLNGAPVAVRPRQRAGWLQFDASQSRITGSGGCNAVTGTYALDGDTLRYSKVAGTMLACGDDVEQEREFVLMLGKVRRWLVAGSLLELVDDEQRLLARFEAAPAGRGPQ